MYNNVDKVRRFRYKLQTCEEIDESRAHSETHPRYLLLGSFSAERVGREVPVLCETRTSICTLVSIHMELPPRKYAPATLLLFHDAHTARWLSAF